VDRASIRVGAEVDVHTIERRRVRAIYEFIKSQRDRYSVQTIGRVIDVAPSGYYKWLKEPLSNGAQEDASLLRLIRASFVASQGIYGAPRIFLDLREAR
jgi:putative transposase